MEKQELSLLERVKKVRRATTKITESILKQQNRVRDLYPSCVESLEKEMRKCGSKVYVPIQIMPGHINLLNVGIGKIDQPHVSPTALRSGISEYRDQRNKEISHARTKYKCECGRMTTINKTNTTVKVICPACDVIYESDWPSVDEYLSEHITMDLSDEYNSEDVSLTEKIRNRQRGE